MVESVKGYFEWVTTRLAGVGLIHHLHMTLWILFALV